MDDFYVYEHYDKEGTVFYVGKGKGGRAWSTEGRNEDWHLHVADFGLSVRIVCDEIFEDEAYDLEKRLIDQYGRVDLGTGTLVNKTSGGGGITCERIVAADVDIGPKKLRDEWEAILEAEGLGAICLDTERSLQRCREKKHSCSRKYSEHEVYGDATIKDSMLEKLAVAMSATAYEARIADRRRASICGLDHENRPVPLKIKRKHREPGKDWRKRINDHILHTYA